MEQFGSVALVVAEGAAGEALDAAAATLEEFGIPWRRFAPRGNEAARFGLSPGAALPTGEDPAWRAIIVASPDAREPAALAAATRLPVLRVPSGDGLRPNLELLQTADGNLPAGDGEDPFATLAVGEAGAKNAALFVIAVLALTDDRLRDAWTAFRLRQTEAVLNGPPLTLDRATPPS